MTSQEVINKLILIRDGYKNLDENGADEFRIIGKGVNATVEYSKTSYSEYVEALDIAISAVEKQTPKKPLSEDWRNTKMIKLSDEQKAMNQIKAFNKASCTNIETMKDANMLDYQSPITVVMSEMQQELENNVFKAVQNVGIAVDKEELIKALEYDRGQYEKGYKCAEEQFAKYARWNDCNDKLPEDRQKVLVQTIHGRIQIAHYFEDLNRWINDHGLDIDPQMVKYWVKVLPLNTDED